MVSEKGLKVSSARKVPGVVECHDRIPIDSAGPLGHKWVWGV